MKKTKTTKKEVKKNYPSLASQVNLAIVTAGVLCVGVVALVGSVMPFVTSASVAPTSYIKDTIKIGEGTTNGPTGLADSDGYGSAIASIGDLDDDGIPDMVVGAENDEFGAASGAGAIFVHFMNADGSIDSTVKHGQDSTNGPTNLDASDSYGTSVAALGDLDGDDIEDIVVGAPGDETGAASGAGAIFIHFMNADGSIKSSVKIGEGTTNGPVNLDAADGYGGSVANIGDINDDGIIDIAVGAVLDEMSAESGVVYIHFLDTGGSIKTTTRIGDQTANGPGGHGLGANDRFGVSITGLGDLNSDGVEDIAVGADADEVGSDAAEGAVYILFLNDDGSVKSTVKLGEGTTNGIGALDMNDRYGSAVANIGDINGDSTTDIVVGAFNAETSTQTNTGTITLHLLTSTGGILETHEIGQTGLKENNPTGLNENDAYGISVANLGDLDDDGYNEIGVGASNDEAGATNNVGAIFIHMTSDTVDFDLLPDLQWIGTTNDNGTYTIGDVIEIEAFYDETLADGSSLNVVLNNGITVILSKEDGQYLRGDYTVNAGETVAELNVSSITTSNVIDTSGDIQTDTTLPGTGNNLADTSDIGINAAGGSGFVKLLGYTQFGDQTTNGPTLDSGNRYGLSADVIGDLDGNGYDDIVVGADQDTFGSAKGSIFIHLMGASNTILSTVGIGNGTTNGPTLSGNADLYGTSVAALGDLDGDDVEDIVVGAPGRNRTAFGAEGGIFIHYLNSDGSVKSTVTIDDSTANGPDEIDTGAGDLYGQSVENIGDLNDDGVIDIAVGASWDESGVDEFDDYGAVYIHFMNTNGTIDSTVQINELTTNGPEGLAFDDNYGYDIAGMGDMDGDGVEDIIVGAPQDEQGSTTDLGAIYVHFMNTDGSIDSTVKIGEDTANGPSSLAAGGLYGASVANVGDLDSNGVNDVAVGQYISGKMYIHMMRSDGNIIRTYEFGPTSDGGPELSSAQNWGAGLAGLGDWNGDDIPDMLIGAYTDEMTGGDSNAGAFYIQTLDTTVPELLDKTGDGSSVTLTYNQTLDTGSVPSTGDYTLTKNGDPVGISSVSVNSLSVVLGVSQTFNTQKDDIKLTYTPGSSPVRNEDGGEAFAFVNLTIINASSTSSGGSGVRTLPSRTGISRNTNSSTGQPVVQKIVGKENKIIVTVSEALNPLSVPLPENFQVYALNPLSGLKDQIQVVKVSIEDSFVYMELERQIIKDEVVTLTYKPKDKPLEDKDELINVRQFVESSVVNFTGTDADLESPMLQEIILEKRNEIVLVYDEQLNEGSIPNSTDIQVVTDRRRNPTFPVVVQGNTVRIKVFFPVVNEKTVLVSYRKGGSPLQDSAGNHALGIDMESLGVKNTMSCDEVVSGDIVTGEFSGRTEGIGGGIRSREESQKVEQCIDKKAQIAMCQNFPETELTKGMNGFEPVAWLQRYLAVWQGAGLVIDAQYGTGTEKYVQQVQQKYNLEVTGKWDPQTWSLLKEKTCGSL